MSNALSNARGSRGAAMLLLSIPIVLYALVFLTPLASIVSLSVDNSALGARFERLNAIDADGDPDQRAAALLADLGAMDKKQLGEAARLLNVEKTGFRTLILTTGKDAKSIDPTMDGLVAFDKKWGDQGYWDIVVQNAGTTTWRYYQKATGLSVSADGDLTFAKGGDIYLRIMGRTLYMTLQVTLLTLVIGYPLAYGAATGSRRTSTIIMAIVLLSFWTSVLVRTTAWVVLLQNNGLINNILIGLRLTSEPVQLIFNRFGALVAMTHVLLPFAILPMINVMRTIPKSQSDASRNLGAGAVETFLRVYFPQSVRGVLVGGGTVFILALGFYVTPALTGGPNDQMLAYFIADFVNKTLNWGMASALSVLLLLIVVILVATARIGQWAVSKRQGDT
ncbi:MAG TPA: ABC transporter permease [Pararhizobium sp.]|uniref:ABC transporter permease n=1 Tax=Pararhizobium sp. TaxID=1977563 RepID=UPI002B945229|nr:ABC transporter permease [Pararhizobium sp.]HTO34321.1 ABC transporter permease [Pararhizobium sp.]